MRAYPVNMEKEGKYYVVTFPDIPEAITQGKGMKEALQAAHDALESAMEIYFMDRKQVPAPSKPKKGQHVVELSASTTAKVLLLNEMLRQKIGPSELARRIGTTKQEVNRLTNIRHTSKIDGIDLALRALGRELVIDFA
jgi:antitoxin HicB